MNGPLALTMGDPAGIGPEIAGKAWRALRETGPAFCYFGDAAQLGVPTRAVRAPDAASFADALPVMQIDAGPVTPGRRDPSHAAPTIAAIEQAAACARAGMVRGIVTNPITKASLYAAGFAYPGHTEFLGALTGATPVMMLACPELRVVPVTIHVSLRDALAALTTELIVAVATIAERELRRKFGIAAPRLAVAGLNPHAGEGGAMGDEEARIIAPAIARLRAENIDATGPFPPDTLFTPGARATYDCVIGMYHDQVLIPVKTLDVFGGVNMTLGLPIIRTSPDHGTAYGIAGQGIADPGSLIAAIRMADRLAR